MANPDDEPQTEFTLKLVNVGDKKISVLKVVMQLTGIGKFEAKDLIERAPVDVLRGVSHADAMRGRELLEKAGAWTEID